MKFIVIRDNLKNGIVIVEKSKGDNLNLPILKNILLETEENKIKITTTNLEVSISYFVSGKVIEDGKFTAPADILSNIIGNLESDRLNIENKNSKLIIKTDNYDAAIQGALAEDFPVTPKIKNQKEFIEIKSNFLKEAIGQVLSSSQFSDLRPELNSILFDFSIDSIRLAATDSFRLSEKTLNQDKFSSNMKEKFKLLVPLKTAKELLRILNDEDVAKIYRDENQVLFKTEKLEFLSRLIDGNFPDYSAIIPKKFNTEIILNRQEFMNALKLTGVFGNRSGEVKIKQEENRKSIRIFSSDQSLGENNYVLTAKTQGKFKEIIFNWRYLMDALRAISSEEIFFGINDENSPAEIKPIGDASYFYILKPIAGI